MDNIPPPPRCFRGSNHSLPKFIRKLIAHSLNCRICISYHHYTPISNKIQNYIKLPNTFQLLLKHKYHPKSDKIFSTFCFKLFCKLLSTTISALGSSKAISIPTTFFILPSKAPLYNPF